MNDVGRIGVVVSVFCLATAASVGRGENIVPNPGFETGTTAGWDGDFTVTSAVSHTGSYSAELGGEMMFTFDPIPITRIERCSFWIKYDSLNSFAYYSVWWETRSGQPLVGAVPLDPYTLDWSERGVGVGTIADRVVKGITIGGWGAFVDDVQILLKARQVKVDIERYPASGIPFHREVPFSATVLGSSAFDIHDVDLASLALDGTAPLSLSGGDVIATEKDLNGDGFMDLRVRFSLSESAYSPDVVTAELSGRLLDGTEFFGTDAVHAAVPEPTSVSLLALGVLAMIRCRRRARS